MNLFIPTFPVFAVTVMIMYTAKSAMYVYDT